MVKLQIELEEELKTRLKLQAVRQNQTMSQLVADALVEYLGRVEPKK